MSAAKIIGGAIRLLSVASLLSQAAFYGIALQNSDRADVSFEKIVAPELRYRIIKHFGQVWFCDPDTYPVARLGREQEIALRAFPQIQGDSEAFRAIAKQLSFKVAEGLSNEQKIAVYREYKKLRWAVHLEPSGVTYKFRIAKREASGGFRIEGLINANGDISILHKDPTFLTCPICLAGDTLIDSPSGAIAIKDLRPGMLVWTLDARNRPVAMPILRTVTVQVSVEHPMVQLVMKDGRELKASPGHPTADGRTVVELAPDTAYDGGHVESVEVVAHQENTTYDLLPAGDTGFYWANGVLLGSTLR